MPRTRLVLCQGPDLKQVWSLASVPEQVWSLAFSQSCDHAHVTQCEESHVLFVLSPPVKSDERKNMQANQRGAGRGTVSWRPSRHMSAAPCGHVVERSSGARVHQAHAAPFTRNSRRRRRRAPLRALACVRDGARQPALRRRGRRWWNLGLVGCDDGGKDGASVACEP